MASFIHRRLHQIKAHIRQPGGLGGRTNDSNKLISGVASCSSGADTKLGNKNLLVGDQDRNSRLSASLILIKPLARSARTDDGFNYHTLLLERHATKGSFVSAYVFPGGNIDADDYHLGKSRDPVSEALDMNALRLCAIRETFEESGILVGNTVSEGASLLREEPSISFLSSWRQKINNRIESFSTFIDLLHQDFGRHQNTNLLSYHANYLTPLALPKRWNTHFFISVLLDEENVMGATHASVDGTETVSMRWMTPLQAIKSANPSAITSAVPSSPILLAPPQYYLLAELSSKPDYEAILANSNPCVVIGQRDGSNTSRRVISLIPELVKPMLTEIGDTGSQTLSQLVLPGDPQHSETDELIKSVHHLNGQQKSIKHRIYIRSPSSSSKSKFFTPVGVERIGMTDILGKGWEDMVVGQVG